MKIGFLFPGQGAQSVGMGKDIYQKFDCAKEVYDSVQKWTGIDIKEISFEDKDNILNETKNTQLATLTESLAIVAILNKNNIKADEVAGLSLGEYSALIYSGAIEEEQGVKLVQKRGEYMQELVPEGDWKMAAIIGLEDSQVEDICKNVKEGFVVPANYNTKGQVVVSGDSDGVYEVQKIAKNSGARLVKILNTAGPFHTEKLSLASDELKKELKNVKINKFNVDVLKNIDGEKYTESDDVKEILAQHITHPVMFSKTLQNMIDDGVDTFIEVGPGKTLSGFAKRIQTEKKINILNISDVSSLEQTIEFIKKEGEVQYE